MKIAPPRNEELVAPLATCIWVLLFVYVLFVVNLTINTTPAERLQLNSLLFATNCTDRMFFLLRLYLAQFSHPGHSTTLMRWESTSGK